MLHDMEDVSDNDLQSFMKLASEQAQRVRYAGLSNVWATHFDTHPTTKTVDMIQNKFQPYWQDVDVREKCNKDNIVYTGYSILGGKLIGACAVDNYRNVMGHVALLLKRKADESTGAKLIVSWAKRENVIPIVKTTNPERMKANFNAFINPKITDDELETIKGLDAQPRIADEQTYIQYIPENMRQIIQRVTPAERFLLETRLKIWARNEKAKNRGAFERLKMAAEKQTPAKMVEWWQQNLEKSDVTIFNALPLLAYLDDKAEAKGEISEAYIVQLMKKLFDRGYEDAATPSEIPALLRANAKLRTDLGITDSELKEIEKRVKTMT